MSEEKLISPLLDHFVMGPTISDHHGVRCCPAMTKDTSKRYIVKIISIPASQVQVDALLLAGAYSNKMAALSYFKELADGIAVEAEILKKLSRFEGFVPYEDLQIVEMEDGKLGYQVYLLSPYKLSLERHMRKKPLTQLQAVNLGLDLCASMVMARRAGYLYVDLKPSNIYFNDKNEYCVGDLGFVRLDSLKYASLPDKYRSSYTAPELDDVLSSMNETVDTYAIGMILYQIYNGGKLPQAGELTPPAYADQEMAEIILKAINQDPQQRWKDPMEMGQALVAYMQRNSVNDVPIIPLPEPAADSEEPAAETDSQASIDHSAENSEEDTSDAPVEPVEPDVVSETAEEPASNDTEIQEEATVSEEEPAAEEEPVSEEELDSQEAPLAEEDPTVEETSETEVNTTEDPEEFTLADTLVNDDSDGSDTYDGLSDETSDILAQADELLAMEIPEPIVAPESTEDPVPAPIFLTDEVEAPAAPVGDEVVPAEGSHEEVPHVDPAPAEEEFLPPTPASPVENPELDVEKKEAELPPEPKKKGKFAGIIAAILILALLLGAAAFGFHYYNNEYLQFISSMEVSGYRNVMLVRITADIDESLLTVVCTDSYGNSITSGVSDGLAVFMGLNSDTIHKVSVMIDGFHELRGETTGTYTTPALTNIVQFTATAGNEFGSVILTFAVDGKDSNNWTITYSTEGETPKSQVFSGHILTVSGLTPGKTYRFQLSSNDDLYMVGNDTVTYAVDPLLFAENLSITQCTLEGLTVVWTAPAGTEGISWTIRCYNNNGFDQTIETTELTATFTEIDPAEGYTVEVTAQGMSTGTITHISARSASITGSQADTSEGLKLKVSWTFDGDAPQTGWLVTYGIKDSGVTQTVLVTEPALTIYPAMPADIYEFTVTAADGISVINNTFTHTAGPVQVFSGYGITADNLSFNMCRTPDKADWTWRDLPSGSYTDTYYVGEKASFVVKVNDTYELSNDYIDILFVIRNQDKDIVCTSSTGSSWTYLWDDSYCELDIPTMPTTAGSYTIEIYFNGMAAARDFFTIY